ncbi:MAG: KipI family sensor histidine kinase inhibitor [Colwellia sp.]
MSNILTLKNNYRMVENGDSAITLLFDLPASEQLTKLIMQLSYLLKCRSTELTELIPAYNSLTICFNPLKLSVQSLKALLKELLQEDLTGYVYQASLIEIPVCYHQSLAPDLDYIASYAGINSQDVIAKHTQPEYLVHMLGFLPGFLYLGGLVPELCCPRKQVPQLRIAPGSVGIGGDQTGIYPVASPGGWHIIGQTPLNLFAIGTEKTFIAAPLDKIKFVEISLTEFNKHSERMR